jgi:hypothetical protein
MAQKEEQRNFGVVCDYQTLLSPSIAIYNLEAGEQKHLSEENTVPI